MKLWKCPYCMYGRDVDMCKDVRAMRNHESCQYFEPAGYSDCSSCAYKSRTEDPMMSFYCEAKRCDVDSSEQHYCKDIALKC